MKITMISPGSYPFPPAACTSVEIYLAHVAECLARRHDVRIYGWGKPSTVQESHLTIHKWSRATGRDYLPHVMTDLPQHEHSVVQIDNRPAYVVPVRQSLGVSTPVILNLHSTTFISKDVITPEELTKSFQAADKIVVNSRYMYQMLANQHSPFKNKLHIIHPGVDIRDFPSRESEAGERIRTQVRKEQGVSSKTVLLFVGRFTPRKGIALLLQVFAKLVKQFPNLELWIVGAEPTGTTPFHKQIDSLAAGLPVRFFAYMPAKQVISYYLAADLLICPSQLSEAFGMVNIEAASCGLPAVGSDAWGIRESIIEGTSGWRVQKYNQVDAWVETLNELLRDPQKLKDISQKARTWAETSFSWERVAQDFAALYKSLQK